MADTIAIKIKTGFGNIQIGVGPKHYASVAGILRIDPDDVKAVTDHLKVIGAIDDADAQSVEQAPAQEVAGGTQ